MLPQHILKKIATVSTMVFVLGLFISSNAWSKQVGTSPTQTTGAIDEASKAQVLESFGKMPMGFEENIGQTDAEVKFTSKGLGYNLFLMPTEAVLVLSKQQAIPDASIPGHIEDLVLPKVESRVLRMSMVGANKAAMAGVGVQAGKSNYMLGHDKSEWYTGIKRYSRVHYENVYEGIDLAFYGNQQQLEYDFIVKAGASVGHIHLAFSGADSHEIDKQGNLVLHIGEDEIIQHAPLTYQMVNGKRHMIDSKYTLAANGDVGFEVASYDVAKELIIDPVLLYASVIGGTGSELASDIVLDAPGNNIYITGYTASTSLAGIATGNMGVVDAFVAKLNAIDGSLVYVSTFGGAGADLAICIAIDASGNNVYLAGRTTSTTFGGVAIGNGGSYDAFITKLNAANGVIVYTRTIAGTGIDVIQRIAIDASGNNVYLAGATTSTSLLGGMTIGNAGLQDAFIAKLNAVYGSMIYMSTFGGAGNDSATDIAIDASGNNAYLAGFTTSTTLGGVTIGNAGMEDAFITKFNAGNAVIVYTKSIGGVFSDRASGLAIDASGNNVYLAGSTYSTTLGGVTIGNAGTQDAFIVKLNAANGVVVYTKSIGGIGLDIVSSIAIDASGNNVYLAGSTTSTALGGVTIGNAGSYDAFITKLNAVDGGIVYAKSIGGAGLDVTQGLAIDASGNNAYLAGYTNSTSLGGTIIGNAGSSDAFIAKLGVPNAAPVPTAAAIHTAFATAGSSQIVAHDPNAGDTFTYAVSIAAANGIAMVNATGLATYTPSVGYSGIDRFDVIVTDNGGLSGTVTIYVTVDAYVDTINPVVTAPADITIPATGPNGIAASDAVVAAFLTGGLATDNVGVVGGVTTSTELGTALPASFPVGVSTVQFNAVDAAGNAGLATATIRVLVSAASATFTASIPLADINGSGVSDLAVLKYNAAGNAFITTMDGATGATISTISLFAGYYPVDVKKVPDLNGNGIEEFAVLAVSATGQPVVEVRDAATGAVVSNVWFSSTFVPQALTIVADSNGNGTSELAVMGQAATASGQQILVQVKDGLTGASVNSVWFAKSFTPLSLDTMADINGNGIPELVILGIQPDNNKLVQVKDVATGATIKNTWFNIGMTPQLLRFSPDVDGNGAPELVLMGHVTSGITVQVKDALTSTLLQNLFLSPASAIGMEVIADINGNAMPEVVVMGTMPVGTMPNANKVAQVVDMLTGTTIRYVWFSAALTPQKLAIVPDYTGNAAPELAVLGLHTNGNIMVEVRDALTGAYQINPQLAPGFTAESLSVVADVNGNGVSELGIYGLNATGAAQLKLLDASTGVLVGDLLVP